MAVIDNPGTPIGQVAPDFELLAAAGGNYRLSEFAGAPAVVVYFTCNHCPYAVAWQERLAQVAADYQPKGVVVLAVSSNDATNYPADSFEHMVRRVTDEQWNHPYLYDQTQQVAREFDAKVTPDVFVLDSQLRFSYRGAPDSDYQDQTAGAAWLRAALDSLLVGKQPQPNETSPVGCSVKWAS